MITSHKLILNDSRNLHHLDNDSIDLVVTSPPYPMIQMWDELFCTLSTNVKRHLDNNDGNAAFEAMHVELDRVWRELFRVLKPGCFACINIGDATRTIAEHFQLYPNHSRIIHTFQSLGFTTLPVILWRKPTNAPNKFMGSGMLPAGAYVTLEHEYILIFRKGGKQKFTSQEEKTRRLKSAFFWEERNQWFSDVWSLLGTNQSLTDTSLRSRSAAYPFELAYRLINMYSLYEDTVLDPFMGTGTTALAAIACGRSSIGIEIDKALADLIIEKELLFSKRANTTIKNRIVKHLEFIRTYTESGKTPLHVNTTYGFPVITKQEAGIQLYGVESIKQKDSLEINVEYTPLLIDNLHKLNVYQKNP